MSDEFTLTQGRQIPNVDSEKADLLAEIERLKACAKRTVKVKGKTISVEMPSPENGMRFFVSAPHLTNEETLAEILKNTLVLLCEVMKGMKEATK